MYIVELGTSKPPFFPLYIISSIRIFFSKKLRHFQKALSLLILYHKNKNKKSQLFESKPSSSRLPKSSQPFRSDEFFFFAMKNSFPLSLKILNFFAIIPSSSIERPSFFFCNRQPFPHLPRVRDFFTISFLFCEESHFIAKATSLSAKSLTFCTKFLLAVESPMLPKQ